MPAPKKPARRVKPSIPRPCPAPWGRCPACRRLVFILRSLDDETFPHRVPVPDGRMCPGGKVGQVLGVDDRIPLEVPT